MSRPHIPRSRGNGSISTDAAAVIGALQSAGATTDEASLTADRLRMLVGTHDLRGTLDELLAAGLIREVRYVPRRGRAVRDRCRSTGPVRYGISRYRLVVRNEPETRR